MRGDRVVKVRGDADDVFSHGFLCPKGVALQDLHEDPDRLRTPLVRDADGELRPASWDEALGRDRGAAPAAARGARPRRGRRLHRQPGRARPRRAALRPRAAQGAGDAGTSSRRARSTSGPRRSPPRCMFGTALTVPIPDVDRTTHLLMLGANPLASNGSLLTAPDMRGRLRALRARGGKLVVVDPRRSRTARGGRRAPPDPAGHRRAAAVRARPRALRRGPRARRSASPTAWRRSRRSREPFTPEAVAPATGIAAGRDPPHGPRAGRRPRRPPSTGGSAPRTQEFGTLASWLVDVLNVLTGNLDRPGGAMFPLAAAGQRNASGAPGRGRAFAARALALTRARAARVDRRAARRRARRGDRDAGRGPGPRADHARRQPGALDAELGADGARRSTGSTSTSRSTSTSTRPRATPT